MSSPQRDDAHDRQPLENDTSQGAADRELTDDELEKASGGAGAAAQAAPLKPPLKGCKWQPSELDADTSGM